MQQSKQNEYSAIKTMEVHLLVDCPELEITSLTHALLASVNILSIWYEKILQY